jgi:hypothetical protein
MLLKKILAADEQKSTSCTYIFVAVKKIVLASDFLTVENPQIKNFCLGPRKISDAPNPDPRSIFEIA